MTPPGNYEVNQKVVHPIWEHPYKKAGSSRIGSGSANPLGNHWIGFHAKDGGFYGIHGTNRPASVGKFVSHGCVRMHNEDVETLFELVRVGTPVKVTYDRYRLEQRGRSLLLEIFPDPYQIKPLNEQDIISRIRSKAPYAHIKHSVLEKALRDQARDTLYEVALLYHLSYPADGRTQNFPSPSVSPFTSRYAGVYGTFGRQSYLFY
jgi:hypothetical protein